MLPSRRLPSLPRAVAAGVTRSRWLRLALALSLLAGAFTILSVSAPPALAGPPPVITSYVPLPTDDYATALNSVNSSAGSVMNERIGITIAGDGAIVYYDHWEDGYESDIANPPVGSTTHVWGDGDISNGNAATHCATSCAGDLLSAGDVIILSNQVTTPRNSTIFFDGSDKVASTRGFTLTRAGWGQSTGPLHAGSVAAYDTSRFGTAFRLPVGEDTIAGSGNDDPFNYTGISVMAASDGTVVSIDTDADGSVDINSTIDEGETAFVDGGVMQGASIVTSKPAQAHILTGDVNATYEDRWFELLPLSVWGSSYVAAASVTVTDHRTELWVHNANTFPIAVDVADGTATPPTLNIGPGATYRYQPPLGTASQLSSADGDFYAVATIGTSTGTGSSRHDWGYTLVPSEILTPSIVIGWAPGNSATPPTANYSAVYVAAAATTDIYVDYDGDPANGYDVLNSNVAAFTSLPITDPDFDMTGARIYTVDGTKLTAAYGQNPEAPTPGGGTALDLGITVVPSTALVVTKNVALVGDQNGDGFINPGDTIRWDVTASDAGSLSLTNTVLSDAVPLNTTYVPGSTQIDLGAGPVPIADDASPPAASVFPLDEGGLPIGSIDPGATISAAFLTRIDSPLPGGTERVTNTVGVTTDQASASAVADAPVFTPDLAISKVSDATGPLQPGDPLSYTIEVANTGDTLHTGVEVSDPLPPGVTWQTTSVNRYTTASSTTYTDDFTTGGYAGGTGPWAGNWQEVNDNSLPGSGDAAIVNDGVSNRLRLQNAGVGASRALGDLSPYEYVALDFDFRRAGFENDFEWLQVEISPDGGGVWNYVERFPGPANDATYLPYAGNVTALVGADTILRFATSASMAPDDRAFVDDIVVIAQERAPSVAPGLEPVAPSYALAAPFDLAPDETATIQVDVVLDDPMVPFSEQLVNTASVITDQQPSPSSSTTIDEVRQIDLELSKTAAGAASFVGDTETFTLTVQNLGPSDATGVAVTDLLPAGLSYVSDTSGGDYDPVSGVWTVGDLAASALVSIDVTVTVDDDAPLSNIAQVTAANEPDADSTPANNDPAEDDQDAATVDVSPLIDLELAKTVNAPAPTQQGDPVSFTITVANQGPSDATGVEVRDLLPAEVQFGSATPSQGGYDEVSGVWTVGMIAATGSATLTLDGTMVGNGSVTNGAEITAANETDVDSTPSNGVPGEDDQDSVTFPVAAVIDLELAKVVDNAAPSLGDTVIFTVTVDNQGPSAATGVEVTDLLPAGLTYDSDTSGGAYVPGTGLWTIGPLAAPGSASIDIVATVTSTGTISNTAEVSAANESDLDSTPGNDDPTEDDQDSATIVADAQADLSLSKSAVGSAAFVGDQETFTVTVTNDGPAAATGVTVSDPLPAGLTYVSDTSAGAYDPGTGVWTIGNLGLLAAASFDIVVTVDSAAPQVNIAQVAAADQSDPDSTPANDDPLEDDQDQVIVDVDPLIDLALVKSVSAPSVAVGSDVTWTLVLSNGGPSDATGVTVTDVLPAGLTHVSDTSGGAYNPLTGAWTVPALAAGGSVSFDLVTTVTLAGPITNVAEVTAANEADADSLPNNGNPTEDDQDAASVTGVMIDLELAKTVDDPTPLLGDDVTFTIAVTNQGPSDATGVTVRDVLPAGLAYVSDTAGGAYDPGTGIWIIGPLSATGTASFDVTATVIVDTASTNVAQVAAADQIDADSTPGNGVPGEDDQDSVTLGPVANADLELSKTVDDTTPNRGAAVTFTLAVTNAGPSPATNVAVRDQLDAGLSFGSASGDGSYAPASGVWGIGTIAVGDTVSIDITATVESDAPIPNSAEVVAVTEQDPDSVLDNDDPTEDDQDSVLLTPAPLVDLELAKMVDNPAPNVGDDVTFTITVTNQGPSDATGITVRDLLPAGLTYVSDTAGGRYVPGTGVWTVGPIPATGSVSVDITATVTVDTAVMNSAEVVTADQTDVDSVPDNDDPTEDDQGSATVTPQAIDLELTKTVAATRVPLGGQTTFTITVTNLGPSVATGVTVADLLPAGVTYISDSSGGSYASGTGIWTIGPLAAGGSASMDITASVDVVGVVTNTAEVATADQPDADSTPGNSVPSEDDQQSITLEGVQIDLELTQTVSANQVTPGDSVTFTITVVNQGPSDASGVAVSDLLPPGLVYESDVAQQGAFDPATGIWTVGALPVGASVTLDVSAIVATVGIHTNTAQVSAANEPDVDSTPANDVAAEDDQASVFVTATLIDLELSKSVSNPTPDLGSDVTFTITTRNEGPSAATGVVVGDVLPTGLDYVSDTSGGAYDATSGRWTVGTLPAGGSASISITVAVASALPTTNTAEVIEADQGDADSTPANGVASEDDRALASVVPAVASLSGVLWVDDNRDGIIDGIEQRLSGITVSLLDAGGSVVRTAPTGTVGQYFFADLPPGDYTVAVDLADLPAGVSQVFDPDGVIDAATLVQLAPGDNVADVNFGFAQDPVTTTTTTTPPTTTTTPGDLPRTGADIDRLTLLALFLLAVGGLLVMVGRGQRGKWFKR